MNKSYYISDCYIRKYTQITQGPNCLCNLGVLGMCSGQMPLCYWTVPRQVVSHPNIQPQIHYSMQAGHYQNLHRPIPIAQNIFDTSNHPVSQWGNHRSVDADMILPSLRGEMKQHHCQHTLAEQQTIEFQWKVWLLWFGSTVGMKGDELDCPVYRNNTTTCKRQTEHSIPIMSTGNNAEPVAIKSVPALQRDSLFTPKLNDVTSLLL